jgi:hypothetical protein
MYMQSDLMRFYLIIIVALYFPQFVTAQEKLNEINVDRPGIAESPFTVAPKKFQLETGFDYYKRTNEVVKFLPVTLLRTGISQAAELRVSVKHINQKKPGTEVLGVSPLSVGIKTHVIQEKGWIPEMDILADVIIPMGKSPLQPQNLGHDILLLFQNDLGKKTSLNYNLGLIWDGISNSEMYTSSFCLNYLTTDRFGLFIEYFNFIRKSDSREHGLDGGFTFLLLPLLQADFSAGISLTDGNPNHFFSSGLSFRVQ